MAPSNGREAAYSRVLRQSSVGCPSCALSDGRFRALAAVAGLALLLSVGAVAMAIVQWAMMADFRSSPAPDGAERPSNAVQPREGEFGDPADDVTGHVFWSDDVTVTAADCSTCRTRRDGRRPATSRRSRTRHRNCNYDCRGTSIFRKNHTTAIHFQGFPPGFYHLEQDGAYVWWRPASWYRHMTGFHYNYSTGHVTIRSSGLYFIYSQMVHMENIGQTYAIVINNIVFVKCTKSAPPTGQGSTYEASCYTAGVTMLRQNDQVWIRGIHTSGHVAVRPESTFWGLIYLGASDVQL